MNERNKDKWEDGMDGELMSFIKVWISVHASLSYCYFIVRKIPRGKFRLLSILPIFYLYIVLPLRLSSFHLGGPTAFYLAWLANFKLLLFSFDKGPLPSDPPTSLLRFISIACLPIKIKQDPSPQSSLNSPQNFKTPPNVKSKENPSPQNTKSPLNWSLNFDKPISHNIKDTPSPQIATKFPNSTLLLAFKALLLALLLRIYEYQQHLPPIIILSLYCCHLYLGIEITLAMAAALARSLLGLKLEPQFNEPYLCTSLQDFWGRRWNLMVTSILRPTIYDPIRCASTQILGGRWAALPAILVTFAVSGLMHELIYFYLTRASPTWEVTWFFVLHGICTAVEVIVKKFLAGRFWLHRAVSRPLTLGFVAVTGFWLFFPQLLRSGVDAKAIREYGILVDFVKGKLQ